jgi:tRNA modification GTPase
VRAVQTYLKFTSLRFLTFDFLLFTFIPMHNLSTWNDTIVALATPPGVGAIGVIRLSGTRAIEIATHLFPSKDLTRQKSHTIHVGMLVHNSKPIDEVVASIFISPRSYTGEDVIEFGCHGSPFIQEQIMAACIDKGARLARPGEFTQRAFINGKLDLAQAEAVADLIASNTSASHRNALNNIRGGFSTALKDLREHLIRFSALIELELDFSQEDVEFADRTQLTKLVEEAVAQTSILLHSFRLGNVIRNGVSVAIIGKPNAGKSTLLNRLLNEERAIVSDIPGTTRDTIEEVINLDGILFRLIDTAGIRSHSTDLIEEQGIERSRQKMRQADLVVYLFDANEMEAGELSQILESIRKEDIRLIPVANKIDAGDDQKVRKKFEMIEGCIFISAKANTHLEVLKERMIDTVLEGKLETENVIVTNARHFHALQKVHDALKDVQQGIASKIPGDLLALDIRTALHYLGEITGEISNEDQLDYIFSKFCIGK